MLHNRGNYRSGIMTPVSIGDAMLIADFKEQEREKG